MRALSSKALLLAGLAGAAFVSAGGGCSASSSPPGATDGGVSYEGGSGALGASCVLNTDCVDPLTCDFGVCHQQCVEARDCPTGERCVSVSGNGVCQLPAETSCANGASCPAGLVCTSDNQCRGSCSGAATSCLAGQVCQDGACYDPGESGDASADSPVSD